MSAKIIADSVNNGNRLTTIEVEFPRIILPQVLTHRVFSRNTSSSRAIPVSKFLNAIENEPFIPSKIGKNGKGMSPGQLLDKATEKLVRLEIGAFRWKVIRLVERLDQLGVHKQTANRYLEPFMYVKMIISSTEWENFFSLRSNDAQWEIQVLAKEMRSALDNSVPVPLNTGEWHTPYSPEKNKKVSVARCARVSYTQQDGEMSIKRDEELYNRLLEARHGSPFEHVATPGEGKANYKGWRQLRNEL